MSLNFYSIQNKTSQIIRSGWFYFKGKKFIPETLGHLFALFGAILFLVMVLTILISIQKKSYQNAVRAEMLEDSNDYIETLRELLRENPKTVKTLLGAEVVMLFGIPQFERRDQGSVIWQYKTDVCIVDLFFFLKPEDLMEKTAVHYVDLRSSDGEPLSDHDVPSCFKALTTYP